MDINKTYRLVYGPILILLMIFFIISCGDDSPKIDKGQYSGWIDYDYEKLRFHFDPNNSWLNDKEQLAKGYVRYVAEISNILEMPVPEDTIDIYVYVPGQNMERITGTVEPFHTDNAIHWGGRTPYGYELTKFLLKRKGIEPGQFNAINEGVPHLLDFSSTNYHDKLNRINNSGMYVDILELGDNEKFDSLSHFISRSESASLCGFILYNYGLDRLFMLWNSSIDWRRSIETIFQLPSDEFESNWLDFARQYAIDPDGTVEDDTTQMYRMMIE